MVVWGAAVCNPHPLRYIVAKSILCDHKKPYNPVFKLLLYIKMSMSIHTSILHECSARLCSQYGINALIYIYIYISRYIDALLHNKINILYFYINLFNIFCYGKRLKAGKCRTTLSSILTVRVCVRVDDAIVNHITIHKYTAIHTRATMNMRIYSHRMQRVVMFNEIKYYIF